MSLSDNSSSAMGFNALSKFRYVVIDWHSTNWAENTFCLNLKFNFDFIHEYLFIIAIEYMLSIVVGVFK